MSSLIPELTQIYPDFESLTAGQQRILQAALELFAEKGYASASTGSIARQAGVAEGLIFKHFRSKKELFLKLVRPLMIEVFFPLSLQRIQKIMAEPETSLAWVLEHILRERLAFAQQHQRVLRVMVQEIWLHPELLDVLAQKFEVQIRPVMEARFQEFVAQGEVRPMPFKTFIRLVMSNFMGFVVPRVIFFPHSPWDDEAEIQQLLQTLLQGLAPEKGCER